MEKMNNNYTERKPLHLKELEDFLYISTGAVNPINLIDKIKWYEDVMKLDKALCEMEEKNPSLGTREPFDFADYVFGYNKENIPTIPTDRVGIDFKTNQPIYAFRGFGKIGKKREKSSNETIFYIPNLSLGLENMSKKSAPKTWEEIYFNKKGD